LAQLITQAYHVRRKHFSDEVVICRPQKTMAISVTGSRCQLNCAHCSGRYLRNMIPAELWQKKIKPGIKSVLVSGGCDPNGRVPVLDCLHILEDIKKAGLRINLHTGLIGTGEIEQISKLADTVSFDFVGDSETVKEVYGLQKDIGEYINTYRELKKRVRVIPHICIGLRGGRLSGEFRAIDLLREIGVDGLVFLVFRPTRDTLFSNRQIPAPDDVARVLCKARIDLPKVPLHLGCMRPGGRHRQEVDQLALRCGINRIVQPAPGTAEIAADLGLDIKLGEECCVL